MSHVLFAFGHAPPVVWGLAVTLFAWWRVHLECHPFAPCRSCKGSGQNRGSTPGAYGLCGHGPQRVRFTGRKAAQRHMARIARKGRQ